MLFATALKDYVDQLNDLAFLVNDNLTLVTFLKSIGFFFFDSIKILFIYIFSFQWLTDFVELPCNFKASYMAVLEGKSVLESSVEPGFFQFLEPKLTTGPTVFFTGFFNSFFLALPVSVAHLITARAFLINGLVAGVAGAAGTIFGQLSFFLCVYCGFEFLLMPFLRFEPLNTICGFVLIVNIIHRLVHKPKMDVISLNETAELRYLFVINLLLAWTEQASIFQYFGNLTLNAFPTVLQETGFPYFAGILIGCFIWTAFFGYILVFLRTTVSRFASVPFIFFNARLHKFAMLCIFTLSLTSIPYYGFDYWISAPLGFLSQDRALEFFKAKTEYQTVDKSGAVFDQSFLNAIPFDRTLQMQPQNSELNNAFEDYSMTADNYWRNRLKMRPNGMSRMKSAQTTRRLQETYKGEDSVEARYLEDFYKNETRNRDEPELNTPKMEKDLDKLAESIFSSIAFDYYDESSEYFPYTRKLFREKFYKNPVYKALVHVDMIGFLQGQPVSKGANLNPQNEVDLFKRRKILENYLTSVKDYKELVKRAQNSNTYAEKVYNQQFKGTLDLVRHYYAVSLSDVDVPFSKATQKVLKFDQPLYKTSRFDPDSLRHEELERSNNASEKRAIKEAPKKNIKVVSPVHREGPEDEDKVLEEASKIGGEYRPSYGDKNRIKALLGANYYEDAKQDENVGDKKFAVSSREAVLLDKLEATDGTPFYIGWDSSLRKFLVKKACTPGIPSGTDANEVSVSKKADTGVSSYLSFQSWPITRKAVSSFSTGVPPKVAIPYTPLQLEDAVKVGELLGFTEDDGNKGPVKNSGLLETQSFPLYNWTNFLVSKQNEYTVKDLKKYINLGNTLPPQFDGFAWPGTSKNANELASLIFKIKKN